MHYGFHPFSSFLILQIKNLLLLLAIMRGSLDPVMYFLLDRTFRKQTLILLGLRTQTSTPKEEGAAPLPELSQRTDTRSTEDIL